MDVEHQVSHRISTGVEEYTSVAASAAGRRLVATTSRSTAGLWRVPIRDRAVEAPDAKPVTLPNARSLSPRLASAFMVYRVPKAGTDALWKLEGASGAELWSGADGRAIEGPAIAPDGRHVAFVTQKRGLTRLNVMNADGTGAHRLSDDLDVRGAPAWSPDGKWIAIAAVRGGGDPHLMKISVDGAAPVELTKEYSLDPVWSPSGQYIVYSGADVATTFRVRAVTADGVAKPVPEVFLSRGARRLAFRGASDALIVLKGNISRKDFWEVDLPTGRERQLTDLGRAFAIGDFDVSPDGGEIVFDSSKEASDIVLIDLQGR
jgi:Tol biopolymer transport system component